MTPAKILEVIATYRQKFEELRIGKRDYPHGQFILSYKQEIADTDRTVLEHCHGMLDKMETFVHKGWIEKAFRWLGFIQGCLWSRGVFTLEQLKNHNRPD